MLTYHLEERGREALYEYLYERIKEDILEGRLKGKEKLPSKRMLAEHLKVSVKTVENAYAQLLTEGYIYAEEKKGYFVSSLHKISPVRPAPFFLKGSEEKSFSENFFPEEGYRADLTANHIFYEKFPFATWARVMRETLTDYDTALLKTVPFQGVRRLREEIARYLYRYRGMEISPDCIVIGAGTEYLYGRLLQLLGEGMVYAMENPGYQKIARIYEATHVSWRHVDMDGRGVRAQALEEDVDVIHISPGHHYPTGLVMPVGRRQQLLGWAAERPGRYIVEDDYDCEFRLFGRPVPAMQSLDRNHRVIYMNTFSKTMVPSLRISYMVLPQKLMEKYVNTMSFYSCTASGIEQYALARFMEKGYFERHIRRMTNYYRQRREKVLALLRQSALWEKGRLFEADAGTYFLWKADTLLTDVEIKWAAGERGVCVSCLSEYCFASREKYEKVLIINYACQSDEQIAYAAQCLGEIL